MAFITIDHVKTEAGLTDNSFDSLLQVIVESVLALWDDLTNRVWAYSNSITEYYDMEQRSSVLFLSRYPVDSAVAVQIWDDPNWVWGSDTLLATADYRVDYESGIVHYVAEFDGGPQSVKITYGAGYADTALPKHIKHAMIRQAVMFYKQAKDKTWDVASIAQPGGGTLMFAKYFSDEGYRNIMPEFRLLAERYERKGVHCL